MGTAVGTQVVVGTGVESTYGTPVVVDRFHEILSESLERRNNIITSNGLRAGTRNLRRGSRRVLASRDGGGDLAMEVPTTGFGRFLQQALGGTSTIAQQGGTAAYLQTHSMGSLLGKSMTIQKQLRDESNTEVESFTFHGSKILSIEFTISVDAILQATMTIDAEDVDTSTAAAAASYPSTKLFHFAQGTLLVAGSPVANVLSASTRIENPSKTDRYFLGSGGTKGEPAPNDFPAVGGSLSAEFLNAATFYDRFAADTGTALILRFEGDTIAGAYKEKLEISVPDVRFLGDTPKVGGPDVVVQDVPFEGTFDGTNPGVTVLYQSVDLSI